MQILPFFLVLFYKLTLHIQDSDQLSLFPQVNGVLENLPFSHSDASLHQNGHLVTIQALGSVQVISSLHNLLLVNISDSSY